MSKLAEKRKAQMDKMFPYINAINKMETGANEAIAYLESEDLTEVDYDKVRDAWERMMLSLSMEPDCTKFWQYMNNKGEGNVK